MRRQSKAAYFLVDVNQLQPTFRAEVLEDASMGGHEYGVQVVEEVHNGPARTPIYGVYYDTDVLDHETKWNKAKAEFNVAEAADHDGLEDSLRTAADDDTADAAAKARAAEDAEIERIAKDGEKPNKANAAK